jgi:DNA-binding transcriptional MerR regulator
MPYAAPKDPLLVLRQYSQFAPWNLHDLAAVAGALLEASGVRPTNAAARARPSDRTIRYYVAQGLMGPPEGRGTAATYSYRHLLQILLIKLRQMEGAQLSQIARELEEQTGDVIERRVASALGPSVPFPSRLSIANPEAARGKVGRAIHSWSALGEGTGHGGAVSGKRFATTKWHRIPIVRGLELHIHEGHPLAKHIPESEDIADAVRLAVNRILMSDE